jgi:CRP-like cAMP-binding protein
MKHEYAATNGRARPGLLGALSADEFERIQPFLQPERYELKRVLVEANAPIRDVWFFREGVGSMIATLSDGSRVEVGTVGSEGFVGLPVLFGSVTMAYEVIVQVAGDGWRMTADDFRASVEERPALREMCLRYADYFNTQLAQSVACNRLHSLEQRCARWLLVTHDRVSGDAFNLTQEFLAIMLGVRRAGVSVAMSVFQQDRILTYSRGRVVVLDRERLEAAACECYPITVAALDAMYALGAEDGGAPAGRR